MRGRRGRVSDVPVADPHWPPHLRSPNSCSVFSHTAIGRRGASITLTLTPGPAPAALPRNPIGYCTRSCALIGRAGCCFAGGNMSGLRLAAADARPPCPV
ncbi:unnamed protein product [Pleuronectes platessa]|uniref:Uncharacterized protein n=1 Tax=Pleuronectes platessa TaxID=8262 RepID=A0A9N7YU56_PLEPL|nr:unnamed protein product [Pleuronectes platessa]